jgi:hypothetical protein
VDGLHGERWSTVLDATGNRPHDPMGADPADRVESVPQFEPASGPDLLSPPVWPSAILVEPEPVVSSAGWATGGGDAVAAPIMPDPVAPGVSEAVPPVAPEPVGAAVDPWPAAPPMPIVSSTSDLVSASGTGGRHALDRADRLTAGGPVADGAVTGDGPEHDHRIALVPPPSGPEDTSAWDAGSAEFALFLPFGSAAAPDRADEEFVGRHTPRSAEPWSTPDEQEPPAPGLASYRRRRAGESPVIAEEGPPPMCADDEAPPWPEQDEADEDLEDDPDGDDPDGDDEPRMADLLSRDSSAWAGRAGMASPGVLE